MKEMTLFSLTLSLQYFVIVSVFSFEAVTAQITAHSLLSEKETELQTFVNVVEANARNCEALKDCSGPKTCSRTSCYKYGTHGDPNYQCLGVKNNTISCGANCTQRNFDYTKSFVRLVLDKDDQHIARTVCTHRTLDDHFKSSGMNDSNHFFRVFFGAVDGTTRIYPGADEPDCTEAYYPGYQPVYDPRVRPWFVQSTYVEKAVAVLVDTGYDMQQPCINNGDMSCLDHAINMTLRFLDTLSVVKGRKDYINIMAFPGINGNKSSWFNNTFQPYDKSFSNGLQGFLENARGVSPSGPDTGNSINTAISELNSSTSVPKGHLKVVIVLTGGTLFQNLSELNITENSVVNVFVYNFRTKPNGTECIPAIRASSEVIPHQRFENPLYALHSYYSFLAKVHKSVMKNDTVDYGPTFQDFSGVDNSTLTLSKAAFDPEGELIGVVGIDFFQNKMNLQYSIDGATFQAIETNASRSLDTFNTYLDLSVNVCFTPYILENYCPPNHSSSAQLYKCQSNSAGDEKIGCCGDCIKKPNDLWKKYLVGGVVVGGGGLLILACFTWCWISKRKGDKMKYAETPQYTYPGT